MAEKGSNNSHLRGTPDGARNVPIKYNLANHRFGSGRNGLMPRGNGRYEWLIEDAYTTATKGSSEKHNLVLKLCSSGPGEDAGVRITDFKPIEGYTFVDDVIASVWSGLDRYDAAKEACKAGDQELAPEKLIGKKVFAITKTEVYEGEESSKIDGYCPKDDFARNPGPFDKSGGGMQLSSAQGGGASGGAAGSSGGGAAQQGAKNGAASTGQGAAAVASLLSMDA